MRFFREPPPVTYQGYRKYRQYTRRDFKRVCAHCFRHEDEAGGEEQFEQDHFKPKHLPDVDPADYFNLYWSCRACNGRANKGSTWPTDAEFERGERFCDPCDHDPVGIDHVEQDDGTLKPLTPAGEYTNRNIRLSVRSSLVNQRLARKSIRQQYHVCLIRLRNELERWKKRLEDEPDQEANERHEKLADLVQAYETFMNREPCMLYSPLPEIPPDLLADLFSSC